MIQANGGISSRSDGPPTISTDQVHLQFTAGGLPRRLDVLGLSVPLYPAGDLEDGLAGLHLRLLSEGVPTEVRPLVGLRSGGTIRWTPDGPVTTTQHPGGLTARVALRAAATTAGWFWQVELTHQGAEHLDCDVVAVQDVALAPYGAVRACEYYVCQYLDVTPVPVSGHGVALAVRQNMPGTQQPWALVGCTGSATRWASDALQLTGRERLDGEPWPGLAADLPAQRLQHEHTVTALQTDAFALSPGASVTTGFFGLVLADHPAATSDDDARWADVALADPVATTPIPPGDGSDVDAADGESIVSSLFALAPVLACREIAAEPTLGVVTAAEQRAVLRPHGQLMRTGAALVPDERTVTSTGWMAGSFLSQVTQGHASLGGILSVRRSYLGLFASHGLRIFVAPARLGGSESPATQQDWRLLATPSRWTQELDRCRWEYLPDDDAVAAGLPASLVVEVTAPTDAHELRLTVESDSPVSLFVSQHFVGAGDDGAADGAIAAQTDSAGTTVSVGAGTVRLEWPERSVARVAGCGSLFVPAIQDSAQDPDLDPRRSSEQSDDQPVPDRRGGGRSPFLTLSVPSVTRWALTLTPDLVPVDEVSIPPNDVDPAFWTAATEALTIAPGSDSTAAQEFSRINQVLPWYAHDALIHYLSPRGLEQFTGGAWGTRDVSQGPVGLLMAWDAHDSLREVCVLVLRAQQARGDWPQSFEFYPRHVAQQQSDAHGDVVYWPLLAVAEYLAATADGTLLTQHLPFVGDGAPTAPDSVVAHLEAALDFIEGTMIPGTALPAYGHGDWNDSLQPADPGLAAGLCSTWTVVLQAHALRTLASALDAVPDTGARTQAVAVRARKIADDGAQAALDLLVRDEVMAGYGFFPTPGGTSRDPSDTGGTAPAELLVHPSDTRTGLRYSVLPMIHAISGDLLTRDQAAHHLALIERHLSGPDGARLFDAPTRYHGGPMEVFQRAEASTFFGREIGIMYTHAHLRYAEALARFGDAPGFLRALALANPIGMTERVPSARPRQQTTYYSSSDGAFADRYAAAEGYHGIQDGTVALEGGWRVYSSGPGIYLRLVRENLLGIRHRAARVEIDPVLDPALGDVTASVRLFGRPVHVTYRAGRTGAGVDRVLVADREVPGTPLQNPYRAAGLSIDTALLLDALDAADETLEVVLR